MKSIIKFTPVIALMLGSTDALANTAPHLMPIKRAKVQLKLAQSITLAKMAKKCR